MRAVRLTRFNTPLEDHHIDLRSPGEDEIVVNIRAAGICHSDAHYRAGRSSVALPLTLGHEIAGEVEGTGERVAVHYLLSCGTCDRCKRHGEQFCERGAMIGKERDGGYAERVVVPARNLVRIPDNVSFEQAAIMMCSTATAYHALRLSRLRDDESLAILGFGGLGASALQLARAATTVAVDVLPEKLAAAKNAGAVPVNASASLYEQLMDATHGRGIDVALDFAGNAATTSAALRALAPGGRLMIVAINLPGIDFDPYRDLLARERHIIGCSDHLCGELVELMEMASRGAIDLSHAITRTVPLSASAINAVHDEMERGATTHLRTVIATS